MRTTLFFSFVFFCFFWGGGRENENRACSIALSEVRMTQFFFPIQSNEVRKAFFSD
jgi:hypothetical protein